MAVSRLRIAWSTALTLWTHYYRRASPHTCFKACNLPVFAALLSEPLRSQAHCCVLMAPMALCSSAREPARARSRRLHECCITFDKLDMSKDILHAKGRRSCCR